MSTGRYSFAGQLLRWGRVHGRRDLPWQQAPTAYQVWVSEIMLQQTRAVTVCAYYPRFIQRFPDVGTLAAAELDQVLQLWSGLGYYARARNLHRAAQQVSERHAGALPRELDALLQLPGIGRSTAGAILALGSNLPFPILDGNVKRVLSRYHCVQQWPGAPAAQRQLWALAEQKLPRRQAAEYTQAIMDLGATLCTRTRPQCPDCPLRSDCAACRSGHPERWPISRPAKPLRWRRTCFLIARNRAQEVLLERRPPTGIWGGLWCFPECAPECDPAHWAWTELGLQSGTLRRIEPFVHTFSHFRLEIQPILLQVTDSRLRSAEPGPRRWLSAAGCKRVGLAAPVSRLLAILTTR